MATFTWQDYTPTEEELEAWAIREKEAERDGLVKIVEKRKTIWIGEFEFMKARYGVDDRTGGEVDLCLIHRLHEVKEVTEKELETGLDGEQLDWVVPDEYKGEIAFSRGFMRNLGGNIRRFDKEEV
jgi:hypothetical protein